MGDNLTPAQRTHCMSQIKGKDTRPEMLVRRLIHRGGYRYRLHSRHLSGRPDLVFPSRRKVIFVHGCFWHRHRCRKGRSLPSTRKAFWRKKLEGNKIRDQSNRRALRRQGWDVLVVWECQTKDLERLVEKLVSFLGVNSNLKCNAEDGQKKRGQHSLFCVF